MSIGTIFDEALRHPSPGFALGQRLAEQYPDLAMIEGESSYFDVQQFAADGHCEIAKRGDAYHQYNTTWYPGHGTHRRPRVAWLDVTWQGEALQVVILTYPGSFDRDQARYYILGATEARCTAFLEAVSQWNHEVRGEILVFSDGCFSKSTALYNAILKASFDQLVLDGTFRQQIRDDFTQFLSARADYEASGVPWKRGALFVGPPGNGKTLCVKALVKLLAIPCIYVQSFEAQHSTAQRSIDEVFGRARATTPCVLVLEDIDALLTPGCRSVFLNALDGFATNTGIITLATTNHPERLDPSIVERPSRFDRKYHFELPTTACRAEYVAKWNERLAPPLRLDEAGRERVVELTHGFSYAYIQEVFVSAMMRWMSARDPAGLGAVAIEQIEQLRAQMQSRASDTAG